jgi:hypothetical protein
VSPTLARRLAWAAALAQPAFVAAWIVAGARQPAYSQADQAFSELAARNAAHPGLMRAAYVVFALSLVALVPALWAVLPRRPATTVAAGLFALAGLGVLVAGLVPLDCGLTVDRGCIHAFHAGELSWRTTAHLWAGGVFDLAFALTPFAVARALWPRYPAQLATLAAGLAIPILAASTLAGHLLGVGEGVAQRLGFATVHLWVLLVVAGILSATRPAPAPGPLIPMRPRDFFGRAWTGRGELTYWPLWLWRPRGFEFQREVDWISDEVWLARDTVRFDDGEVEAHDMVARMAGPDRVHVMGDDVPGGADMLLAEGGYRMAPYRFAVRVGPVRFGLRGHDEVRREADGSLDWTIRFTWLGMPVARLCGRVRPEDAP